MNANEYEQLTNIHETVITGADLNNPTPRTLLYGYLKSGETWHVFLDYDGEIKTVFYLTDSEPLNFVSISNNQQFNPDKRLHPECCDFEFCTLLKQRGCFLTFTNANFDREQKTFYGRT